MKYEPAFEKERETIFTPYRVCPIGAHSDTQFGRITGMAIDKGITIAYQPTENGTFEIASDNFAGTAFFSLDKLPPKQGDWADHMRGAVQALKNTFMLREMETGIAQPRIMRGLRAHISGSLPIGGLSSSASVIISFLHALCRVNEIALEDHELILTAQWAENRYVGVSCGKLDQSCEVYCRKDHLLYLDTLDDSYQLIATNPAMKPYEIAIFFSGLERTLVGSKFNMRVDELKAASYALKGFAGLDYGKFSESYLRDVPREVYEQYKHKLPDPWRMRAEHWYTEQERVLLGAQAWREGDLETYGRLSFESGKSSIVNYETGSEELIALYEIMRRTDGIYGGRFSGAGFKGCCMALVDPGERERIARTVTQAYTGRFPKLKEKYSVHFCKSADGVGGVRLGL